MAQTMKSKRSKATDIPKKVKDKVWERDGHKCIICGSHYAMPNSHYISRSKGGLGIPENIITMCAVCHHLYDNGGKRDEMREEIRKYLMQHYPDLDESKLVYRKCDQYESM